MRVLFASTAGAGHFNPLKPWIRACAARGDDVLVVVPPSAADAARATGAPVLEGPARDEAASDRVWREAAAQPPDEVVPYLGRHLFCGLNTDEMLPTMRRAVADFGPDLVLREPMEYAAALVAAEAGVPQVRVAISQAGSEHRQWEISGERFEERLPGGGALVAASPLVTRFPASIDPDGFPDTRRYRLGPALPGALPDWWGGSTSPLVYVTFGTEAPRRDGAGELFRTALDAVAGLPVRVLLTVGNDYDPAALGEVPSNVHVEHWADHATVLAEADVVVHHGGSGSTLDCLAAGVPQVVLPLFADQPFNARSMEASGVGISLATSANQRAFRQVGPAEAPSITAAIAKVLSSDRASRCHEVQEEMAGLPLLAEVLQSLA